MEIYQETLCISHEELTSGEIVTKAALETMVRRGKVRRMRRGCYGQSALYAVESLPLKYRIEVYHRHPDLVEQAESRPFIDNIEEDVRARLFYADFQLPDGRHLPTEKQEELTANCSIFGAFQRVMERADSHRIRQSKHRLCKTEFWRKASAALPRIADRIRHSLPESPKRLAEKYARWCEEGPACFIDRTWGNKNSAKVASAEQESLLIYLMAHHNNLDNTFIARAYNEVARQNGWKEITPAAVSTWCDKRELVTSVGRLGASNFRAHRAMQVKRSRPTLPCLMWSLDGWTVELLYQKSKTDSRGRTTTTYHNRLTVEIVLDPFMDYPIGYAIGTHETPELIRAALRDAACHTREITGQMLRAWQIQCDHYALKASTPLYKAMANKVTPAQVKNAKAKPVEPYFGHLNKTYCRLMDNWSGYGVTTDPSRQPNSEALNLHRRNFPDEEGCRRQIAGIIAEERRRKAEQYHRLLRELPDERRLELGREQFLLHFGAETGYRNALEGGGLRPTLMGTKRDYECWDISWREHADCRWAVRYDPSDLSTILAVSEDGTLRYLLEEKHIQPMALADRRDGDTEALHRVWNYNRSLETHVSNRLSLAYEKAEEVIARLPQQDILGRLLVCDSEGRHKLPRAIARGDAAEEAEDYDIF